MKKEDLKKIRMALGHTQESLSKVSGYSLSAITKYEVGKLRIPKRFVIILEALCKK